MKNHLSLLALLGILIMFLVMGISACDKLKVSPDIRKEQVNDPELKPDYFGIRWDMKW